MPQDVKKQNSSKNQKKGKSAPPSKEMKKIHNILQMTPELRSARVSTLKRLIQIGQYQVPSDVLAEKMPVEVDRRVDLLHDGIGAGGEPPAPHLVAHDTPLLMTGL